MFTGSSAEVATPLVEFFVPGLPQPGGSKRAFVPPKLGRAVVVDANPKAKDWKRQVAVFAKQAYAGAPLRGAVRVVVSFVRMRPKGHYGSGRNAETVKASAPRWPTSKPDVLKLMRSTEDALTGILWVDDSQIVWELIGKTYGDQPGARVQVWSME